jgi:hypothetical protein
MLRLTVRRSVCLRIRHPKISQDSRCPTRDSNRAPPKYKSQALNLQTTWYVSMDLNKAFSKGSNRGISSHLSPIPRMLWLPLCRSFTGHGGDRPHEPCLHAVKQYRNRGSTTRGCSDILIHHRSLPPAHDTTRIAQKTFYNTQEMVLTNTAVNHKTNALYWPRYSSSG